MRFEWDENKNRQNINNHGIDFRDAKEIFRGSVLERLDPGGHHETRWQAIGMTNAILFVVYTERGKDTYRLISARKAEPHEEAAYYQRLFGR